MKKQKLGKKILLIFLLVSFLFTPLNERKYTKGENPGPFFSIIILTPNTDSNRYFWAEMIAEELIKIGINVSFIHEADWIEIGSRSWNYLGPYPIPIYDDGGYDTMLIAVNSIYGGYLDDLFHSSMIPPNGDNYYQYVNTTFDTAFEHYNTSYIIEDRIYWAQRIIEILYDDLPAIPVLYSQKTIGFNESLQWDPIAWFHSYQPIIDWYLPDTLELHYGTPNDAGNGYVHDAKSFSENQWLHQIYNGLIERNASAGLVYYPWIAENITTTDGLTYTINIKDNAVWADGTPLTADDVIFNYELVVTPGAISTSLYNEYIQFWDIGSLVKINDKKLTITFKQMTPKFQDYLALSLIPKHIWEGVSPSDMSDTAWSWLKTNPENFFGAGPYTLDEYNEITENRHLVKNLYFDDWFGTEPYFDDIYFDYYYLHTNRTDALNALTSGVIDIVDFFFDFNLTELVIPGIDYALVDDGLSYEMSINMEHPWIGTGANCPIAGSTSAKYIRKAISHLIPREAIISEILGGIGRSGIYESPVLGFGFDFSDVIHTYSLEAAEYYMSLAGFELEDPPTELPTNLTTPINTTTDYSVQVGFTLSISIGLFCAINIIIVIVYRRRRGN